MTILEQLEPYQRHAAEFIATRRGSAIFFEQGTGKTWVVGGAIELLCEDDDFSALLVVPLANIETTWAKLLRQIPQVTVARTWEDFKALKGQSRLLLLHYEALRGRLIQRLIKQTWTLVVYDESQRLKARGSKQSRAAARFKNVYCRTILSGTPIEQAPQDLWAQFRFALPWVLGTRWKDFTGTRRRPRFVKQSGYMGYKWKFIDTKLPEFLSLVEPHILRVKKEDVLDLPPLTFRKAPVMLLGEQGRVYRDLDRTMVTTIRGREVTADMRITQLVRLQQVCGGFVRANPTLADYQKVEGTKRRPQGEVVSVGKAKLRKAVAIVNRETKPVVIFCKYREEISDLTRALAHTRVGVIHGKNRKDRTSIIKAFQRGEYDVLICQVRTGGVGIDLFNARVAIFYSMTFSFIDFDQAVARIHRRGQTRPVTIYLVFAQNTVDEEIYAAVLSKQLISERVLKRRRQWRRTRRRP